MLIKSTIARLFSCKKVQSQKGDFSFNEIESLSDAWTWLQSSFVEDIYPETKYYNGEAQESGYINLYNKQ